MLRISNSFHQILKIPKWPKVTKEFQKNPQELQGLIFQEFLNRCIKFVENRRGSSIPTDKNLSIYYQYIYLFIHLFYITIQVPSSIAFYLFLEIRGAKRHPTGTATFTETPPTSTSSWNRVQPTAFSAVRPTLCLSTLWWLLANHTHSRASTVKLPSLGSPMTWSIFGATPSAGSIITAMNRWKRCQL